MNTILKMFFGFSVVLASLLTSAVASADFEEGKSALLVNFGVTKGGAAMGLDYEFGYARTYGLGAYFRMYPKDNSVGAPGMTALGAFIRPHFNRQNWDFYLSPGFGFVAYQGANNTPDATLLGPSLALGLLYDFNNKISFGVEETNLYSWMGKDRYRGHLSNDLMAKFRVIF